MPRGHGYSLAVGREYLRLGFQCFGPAAHSSKGGLQSWIKGQDGLPEVAAIGTCPALSQHIALTVQGQASTGPVIVGAPFHHQGPLQKYAVTVGGGRNHRYNLSDAAMLKDNHIDAGGGIANAVSKLKSKLGHMTKVELEVRNLDELNQALEAGVDVIMLDNMSPELMKQAVDITAGRALLEASGGITDETLREIAETGVDIISMGALTHSVKAFDISLKIK